jgi:hypothetical protein
MKKKNSKIIDMKKSIGLRIIEIAILNHIWEIKNNDLEK